MPIASQNCEKDKILTMMSLEDYLSHDVIVEANFQYDEPQQRIWNEVQNYLNQLAASDGLDKVI